MACASLTRRARCSTLTRSRLKTRLFDATGKTRITIHIDNDVLEAFRERADSSGLGYQTLINEALRSHLGSARQPVDSNTLRRILREELRKTG